MSDLHVTMKLQARKMLQNAPEKRINFRRTIK